MGIYDMNLHEHIQLTMGGEDVKIIRVAGGWLYTVYSEGNDMGGTTFVPFNNEFMEQLSKYKGKQ